MSIPHTLRSNCLSANREGGFHRTHSSGETYFDYFKSDIVVAILDIIKELKVKLFERNLPDCTEHFNYSMYFPDTLLDRVS